MAKTGRKAMWCHGDMTCTCGETISHQDVIDALRHGEQFEQLTLMASALRDILATLGNTAIVPPIRLAAARDALAKAEGKS